VGTGVLTLTTRNFLPVCGLYWITRMSPRALFLFLIGVIPSFGATFGTVVAHAQPLSDLAIDEARRRIYVVNTASNQIEVYSTTTNPPRLTNTIKTDQTPLAVAIARSGRSLYVAC